MLLRIRVSVVPDTPFIPAEELSRRWSRISTLMVVAQKAALRREPVDERDHALRHTADVLLTFMYFTFLPLLVALASGTKCLASHTHEEDYSEAPTLRPLRDGKLAASFVFTTSLHDVIPRTPNSLGEDDTRA